MQGEHFQNWGQMQGVKNVCFSTKNWPYLGNDERQGQGYY